MLLMIKTQRCLKIRRLSASFLYSSNLEYFLQPIFRQSVNETDTKTCNEKFYTVALIKISFFKVKIVNILCLKKVENPRIVFEQLKFKFYILVS